ncbi:MAG: SdiA-regulated domain-containing protein [Bacteroidia bacterium]|nr:SdiA-regulated domain-containing protein [Bacteroidia bacterium]
MKALTILTFPVFSIFCLNTAASSLEPPDSLSRTRPLLPPVETTYRFPYSLNHPSGKNQLPLILNEVSGLTDIDSDHVACVQDEIGTVFIYNFHTDSIVEKYKFDETGDFEGLTYTKHALYILRSDGRLTEWNNFNQHSGGETILHYTLPILTANNEGLCFDHKYNRLLIAAKSKPVNHDYRSERFIYEFNLSTKKLNPKPLYSINTEQLEKVAKQYHITQNDTNSKGKLKPFNFRPSSLAVHPVTGEIYIISAADHILAVMDRTGDIIFMAPLKPDLYAKAEGITFLDDGTMIITNEGAGKTPTLLLFNPRN